MKPALEAVSASEVNTWLDCPRKWAARYVSDIWQRPYKAGVQTGRALHALAEAYELRGEVPQQHTPISELFVAGLPHMARPGSHWVIEQRIDQIIQGIPFQVKPDWYGPSDALTGAPAGLRAVKDYKTSVDPKAYGVTTLEDREHRGHIVKGKLSDAQSLLYAHVLGGGEDTFFRHLYFEKTGQVLLLEALEHADPVKRAKAEERGRKKSSKVKVLAADAIMPAERIRAGLERVVLPAADALYAIRSRGLRVDPLTMAPNTLSCDAYGGCPHKGRECILTPTEQLQSALGDTPMSDFNIFASLPINGPQASAAPVPTLPPVATPAHVAPAAPMFSFTVPAELSTSFKSAAFEPDPSCPVNGTAYLPQPAPVSVAAIAACQPGTPAAVIAAASDTELANAVRTLFAAFKQA